jgi:hypothetical protein
VSPNPAVIMHESPRGYLHDHRRVSGGNQSSSVVKVYGVLTMPMKVLNFVWVIRVPLLFVAVRPVP